MTRIFLVLFTLSMVIFTTAAKVDFTECIKNFTTSAAFAGNYSKNGTDSHGKSAPRNASVGLEYLACVELCGGGPESPSFTTISQQFSAWLLPWLALLSQLPFGANDPIDNFTSVLLTVGSPTLAAYSLAITVMNGRWVARRFHNIRSPTVENAIRVLTRLQQSPIAVIVLPSLFSLVDLKENEAWWATMSKGLSLMHTWTISARISVLWVIVAYVFTVLDSFFPDITTSINANGQGIGSQFLFLVVIVVGWLQLEPKCDASSVEDSFEITQEMIYHVIEEEDLTGRWVVKKVEKLSELPVVLLDEPHWQHTLRIDEYSAPPIFNYARVLPWTINVLKVLETYKKVQADSDYYPLLTTGFSRKATDIWRSGVIWRIVVSSLFALFLQWGTTGAALIVVVSTPTVGLGCRSLSFLIYAGVSTLIWFFMLVSSFLTFGATRLYERRPTFYLTSSQRRSRIAMKWSAIIIRQTCKIAATLNTVWIITFCCLQFANVFDNCYCNSSVLHWGRLKAYNVITLGDDDKQDMTQAWVGGVFLGVCTAGIYWAFCRIQLNPPMPKPRRRYSTVSSSCDDKVSCSSCAT